MGNFFTDVWKKTVDVHKLLGSAIPGVGPYLAGQEANEANLSAVDKQNQANIALWREQTAYNTPTNQMQRLRDAGLSPQLAYGQIAESKMASAPQMQAPEIKPVPRPSLADFQQVVNMQASNALTRAQADKVKADTDFIEYQTDFWKKNKSAPGDNALLKPVERVKETLKDTIVNPVGGAISRSSLWSKVQDLVEGLSRGYVINTTEGPRTRHVKRYGK